MPGPTRKLLKSCNHCKARKVKCTGHPGPCEGCVRRGLECRFSQASLPRRQGTNVELMVDKPQRKTADELVSPAEAVGPVPELYVDRLLALARLPERFTDHRPYTVKKNGLFGSPFPSKGSQSIINRHIVGKYSLTFFSDSRLQQLSARLRNDKVRDLVRRISSVINSRVNQSDKVSSTSIKRAVASIPTTILDPNSASLYIESFFQHVHPFYPFLERQSFEAVAFGPQLYSIIAQNKAWSALYHAVLALGCQVRGGGSFEPDKGDAWQLFSVALAAFPDLMTLPDSLTVLQAMAAMTIFTLGISCLAIEHVIVSEAARRAQNLGSANLTGNAAVLYSRVFWVLYSVEKISSFHFGRNSVFFDHDIVIPVPSVSEAVFEGFDWFLTSVKYARLLSRAITSLFSAGVLGNPKTYYLAVIDQLTDELENWRMCVPNNIRPGNNDYRRFAQFSNPTRIPAVWIGCLYNSFRLSLCRVILHLAADAEGVVSPSRQATATRDMMEISRSTLELTTLIDVEPYTPLWVIGGIPLTAHFVLFDFVINNPKSSETATNLALLDIAGGHFSRIEYSSGGRLPGSLIGEFAHIAREYINSTASSQSVTTNHRLRSPNASSNGEATLLEKSSFSPLSRAEAFSTDEHTDGSIESDVHEREITIDHLSSAEIPLLDPLYFPINDNFATPDGAYMMGTDVMNLFNTIIPGIDPIFFNQPTDDHATYPI